MSDARFVVLKFGGTSVATPERWRTILEQAKARKAEGFVPVVVCSAVTKMTDLLNRLVDEAAQGRHSGPLAQLRERHAEAPPRAWTSTSRRRSDRSFRSWSASRSAPGSCATRARACVPG
ncbi:MAG: hypothetical protein QM765_23550 [Myxococcales bacterium]